MALKPSLLIRQLQMYVKILALSPVLVEEKYVGIIVADVKMIVDAASLGPRPINETAQKFKKFCTFFWSGVQSSCEGATWFHIFIRLTFDHVGNVHAICFFRMQLKSGLEPGLVGVSRFERSKSAALERRLQ